MEHLALTFAGSILYAIAISVGLGRKLASYQVTLPIVVAGGVLIVLAGYSWGDWQLFTDLLLWFALCSLPLLVRAAVLHVEEDERQQLDAYRITDYDHDRAA